MTSQGKLITSALTLTWANFDGSHGRIVCLAHASPSFHTVCMNFARLGGLNAFKGLRCAEDTCEMRAHFCAHLLRPRPKIPPTLLTTSTRCELSALAFMRPASIIVWGRQSRLA